VTGPVASHPDRLPCRSPLDGGGALGRRPRSGTCSSWAFFASTAALRRSAKLVFLDLFISILYAQGKRLLAQAVDGFRSALATPYSRAWTRPRLKSSRACRGGSLRRSSVCLSDEGTTSVERCRLRSADFPVALLLQSQNRTTEPVSNEHGPHTEESKRKKRISAHPIRGVETYSPKGGHAFIHRSSINDAPSSLSACHCRATRRRVASRINRPVGRPGIKAQEAGIDPSGL